MPGMPRGVATTRVCRMGVIRGSYVEAESATRLVPVCLPATAMVAGALRASRRERPSQDINSVADWLISSAFLAEQDNQQLKIVSRFKRRFK